MRARGFIVSVAVLIASALAPHQVSAQGLFDVFEGIADTLNQPRPTRTAPNIGQPGLSRDLAFAVQVRLNELGFDVGTPDGVVGPATREKISEYQTSIGHPATGRLTGEEIDGLLTLAQDETEDLQRMLADEGYYDGAIDGIMGGGTSAAVAAYLRDEGQDPNLISLRATYEMATGTGPTLPPSSDAADATAVDTVSVSGEASLPAETDWLADIPIVDGGMGILDSLSYIHLPFPAERRPMFQAWGRFLMMARLERNPEFLDSVESAHSFASLALTESEKSRLADGTNVFGATFDGGLGSLNEFERRAFKDRFDAEFADIVLSRAPQFPVPTTMLSAVMVGEYDFESEEFPLTYSEAGGGETAGAQATEFFNGYAVGAGGAVVRHGLGELPQSVSANEEEARAMVEAMDRLGTRRAFIAVNADMAMDETGMVLTMEPSRLRLVGDPQLGEAGSLQSVLHTFDVADYRAVEEVVAPPPAEAVEAREIFERPLADIDQLANAARDYEYGREYWDHYLESSPEFVPESEFGGSNNREDLSATVEAALPEAQGTLWIGGSLTLGRYDIDNGAFSVESGTLNWRRDSAVEASGSIAIELENGIGDIPVPVGRAEQFAQDNPEREVALRAGIVPINAYSDSNAGTYKELNLVARLSEVYIIALDADGRPAEILAHKTYEDETLSGLAEPQESGEVAADGAELTQDWVHLLAIDGDLESVSDYYRNWLFANRWLSDVHRPNGSPMRLFNAGADPISMGTRDRLYAAFADRLSSGVPALPARFTLKWQRDSIAPNDPWGCNTVGATSPDADFLSSIYDGEDRRQYSEQDGETYGRNPLDPVIMTPAFFTFYNESSVDCSTSAFRNLNEVLGIVEYSENDPRIIIAVDGMPVPARSDLGNLAMVAVAFEDMQTFDNGSAVPHVLIRTRFENVDFYEAPEDGLNLAALTPAQSFTPDSFESEAFETPDVLGIEIGMDLADAEEIVRTRLENALVFDNAPPAPPPHWYFFENVRMFLAESGTEYVALYFDGREDEPKVQAVMHDVFVSTADLPADGVVAALMDKYGPDPVLETHPGHQYLTWGENVSRMHSDDSSRRLPTECAIDSGQGPQYWLHDGETVGGFADYVPWEQVRNTSFLDFAPGVAAEDISACGLIVSAHINVMDNTSVRVLAADLSQLNRFEDRQASTSGTPAESYADEIGNLLGL